MQNSGNAVTAVSGFYAVWQSNYDARPYEAVNYEAQAAAEAAILATPAECIGDVLLKLRVATEPAMVASVVRDLERMITPAAIAA